MHCRSRAATDALDDMTKSRIQVGDHGVLDFHHRAGYSIGKIWPDVRVVFGCDLRSR